MQAARKLLRKSWRDREGAYLVEGVRAVADALTSGAPVREVFVTDGEEGLEEIVSLARARGVGLTSVSPRVSAALASTSSAQGATAVLSSPAGKLDDLLPGATLVAVLAGVADPGNAGTLVRSSAAAGADGILFTRGSVDALNPRTVRAAAAALWGIPVVRGIVLEEALSRLRTAGLTLLGADPSASESIYDVDLTRPSAIVLGNEAWGLDEIAEGGLDRRVSVPMSAQSESLNVAVAGSVILFEVARQRRRATAPSSVRGDAGGGCLSSSNG